MLSYPLTDAAPAADGATDSLDAPDNPAATTSGDEPAYTFDGFEIDSSVKLMLTPLGSGGVAGART